MFHIAALEEEIVRVPLAYRTSARDVLRRMAGFKKAPISYEDLKLREADLETPARTQRMEKLWDTEDLQEDLQSE